MRARLSMLALAVTVAGVAVPAGAQENICLLEDAPAQPHVADFPNDYNGFLFGNSAGLPTGDVNREGADIIGGWFSRESLAPGFPPRLTVTIKVQALSGLEVNEALFFLWDHPTGPVEDSRRFLEAQAIRPGATGPVWQFSHGYYGELRTTGGTGYQGLGSTAGVVSVADGLIKMQFPPAIPAAPAGSTLGFPSIESAFLIGAAAVGGLVNPIDDAQGPCDGVII